MLRIPDGYTLKSVKTTDMAIAEILAISAKGEHWRSTVTPDDDLSLLPSDAQTKIEAERTPERLAKFDELRAEIDAIPPLEADPGPSLQEQIDALKVEVEALKVTALAARS